MDLSEYASRPGQQCRIDYDNGRFCWTNGVRFQWRCLCTIVGEPEGEGLADSPEQMLEILLAIGEMEPCTRLN